MVLEHVLPEEWLERKAYYAFFLGAGYSILGIVLSAILFKADPALPAVAFTSLFLLPELYKMFSIEERQQANEKGWGLRKFWKDNGDFFRVFLMLFLGILIVYSFAAMFLPSFSVNQLFREQVEVRGGSFQAVGGAITGDAAGDGLFSKLLKNNALVFLAVFVIAVLAGDGAIFLIVWNASVWGTIFGLTARNAAYFTSGEPLFYFASILLVVLPHVILESSAYILAAIAGGLISKDALVEKFEGKRFEQVLGKNLYILILGAIILIIGALVEALVLQNSSKYAEIIQLSFGILR